MCEAWGYRKLLNWPIPFFDLFLVKSWPDETRLINQAEKKKTVKNVSKKCKIEEAVSNVEIAINSGDQDKALRCFEDLKALLKIKKQQ